MTIPLDKTEKADSSQYLLVLAASSEAELKEAKGLLKTVRDLSEHVGVKDTLDCLASFPLRIINPGRWKRSLVLENGRYYQQMEARTDHLDRKNSFEAYVFHEFSPAQHIPVIIRNIVSAVDQEDISSGETALLKDIAKEAYELILDRAVNWHEDIGLNNCLAVHENNMARMRMLQFGFKLKPIQPKKPY